MKNTCSINGCKDFCKGFGMCGFHYRKWRRYGNPEELPRRRKSGEGSVSSYKRITVDGKRIPEHKYIMECFIKRKLRKDEHVHHVNNNTLDNRIENLKVLTNKEHKTLHIKEYWKTRKGKWSWKYNLDFCLLCGRNSVAHACNGHCRTCVRNVRNWSGID